MHAPPRPPPLPPEPPAPPPEPPLPPCCTVMLTTGEVCELFDGSVARADSACAPGASRPAGTVKLHGDAVSSCTCEPSIMRSILETVPLLSSAVTMTWNDDGP